MTEPVVWVRCLTWRQRLIGARLALRYLWRVLCGYRPVAQPGRRPDAAALLLMLAERHPREDGAPRLH